MTTNDPAAAAPAAASADGPAADARAADVSETVSAETGAIVLVISTFESREQAAPIARAKQAARSELLLVAIDEPGGADGPTELDGERPHPVRVALVDLVANKVLLRARHVVDPSGISPARRAMYAIGLDSCALALEVHEDVRSAASSGGTSPRN